MFVSFQRQVEEMGDSEWSEVPSRSRGRERNASRRAGERGRARPPPRGNDDPRRPGEPSHREHRDSYSSSSSSCESLGPGRVKQSYSSASSSGSTRSAATRDRHQSYSSASSSSGSPGSATTPNQPQSRESRSVQNGFIHFSILKLLAYSHFIVFTACLGPTT